MRSDCRCGCALLAASSLPARLVVRPPSRTPGSFAEPRPPARRHQTEIPLSPEALESSSSCAAYIQRALGSVPPSEKQVWAGSIPPLLARLAPWPPTLADRVLLPRPQVAFAMELAQRAGEVLPESAYESSASVSSYIDAKRGGSAPYAGGAPRGPGAPLGAYGGGLADGASMDAPPTSKQINYLVSLAVRHRSGIPYEALSNRRACSDLIEDLLSKGPAQGSGAATAATPAGQGSAPGDVPPPAGTTLFNDADIPF